MSDSTTPAVDGLLLSDDLMFNSRITGTGRDLGLNVKTARSSSVLLDMAKQHAPKCVILDLANSGLVIDDVVAALRGGEAAPYLVAYGSHVDAATLKAARDAGCDVVLPRSKFVEELPREMRRWFGQN